MSSDFLLEQCKVIEDTFYGGAEDPALRTLVEKLTTVDNTQFDELATDEKDLQVDELDEYDDSLSEVESVEFDPEVFLEAGTDLDQEAQFDIQGGAISALSAPPLSEDLAYQVPSSTKEIYEPLPGKNVYLDHIDTEIGQLEDGMDQLELNQFEDRAYDLELLHEQDARVDIEQEIDRKIDLMEDPMWIQGGVEYMREYRRTVDRFNQDYIAIVTQSRPLTDSGRLIPPQPGYVHCLAWMDRLLTYISSANFDIMPLEQLNPLYDECVTAIQNSNTLSMLPVRPEWLRFQAYVASRRD
jgi:hypothetical protein